MNETTTRAGEGTTMRYGRIEGLEKPVSRLIQGTMMIHTRDQEKANALLDGVYAAGCTTFDCGWVYGGGTSERALGAWLETRGLHDKVVILTKGAHHNADRKKVTPFDITADLHDSLARLRTDRIDLYLLHRDDPAVPVGPIVEVLNEHHAAGRITRFGGSNWTHRRIAEANEYAAKHGLEPFAVSSPNLSLAQQVESPWGDDCVSISGPENAEARGWYAERGMPVLVWSSMARGFFSGRWTRENYQGMLETGDASSVRAYCHERNWIRLDRVRELAARRGATVAQIALAWVLAQPLDLYALVGCHTPAEFAECVAAAALALTEAECDYLDLRREAL